MTLIYKVKLFSRKWFADYALIVIGSLIMASGYSFFAEPYRIVPGGAYGIAIIIHHMTGYPTGVVGLLINIPLFIAGIMILGSKFGIKTFVGTILTSVFIDLLSSFDFFNLTEDMMLISIFAGVLIGVGLALIFKGKATTGGSDIIAQILNRYISMPVGQFLIIIDSVIVISGIVAFGDLTLGLYALITIFLTGKVIDGILFGLNYRKAVFIISEKHKEIRDVLIKNIDRGGTYFKGEGMYSGRNRKVIYTVVNRREFNILKDSVERIDPEAFLTTFDTSQIIGKGFHDFSNV